MFGFIASPCARCTESVFPAWRGSFCGLARCLGREYGNAARMLVNRDATFLALVGMSLDRAEPRWQAATCCNPFAAPFPVSDDHPAVQHAAAVSICGLAAKLDDDTRDEGPARRVASRLGGWFTGPAVDRAVGWLNSSSFPTQTVLDRLGSQEEYEMQCPERADAPTAEAFGRITGHLAMLLELPHEHQRLHALGSSLGSLVYWRDAWDDREADRRRGRFNPFDQLDSGTIRSRIQSAWNGFRDHLGSLSLQRHQLLFPSLLDTTAQCHGSFLELSPGGGKKRRRKKRDSCWDHCDCCHGCGDCCDCGSSCGRSGGKSSGCADACCDTGPGDSGCCDCCPCDGCSCN
ncbi:DUF5685 family protein [Haloferula rosea]|uniref:Uncharacterized protein n=1 Tax=Haloferula rosea TaxID=490093 RepID=A0A934VCR8_9BACT|nr:DUF5685 family protein [Haloferula rosea]MBK1828738.1 hypothetical protein [Haloferula rosea]